MGICATKDQKKKHKKDGKKHHNPYQKGKHEKRERKDSDERHSDRKRSDEDHSDGGLVVEHEEVRIEEHGREVIEHIKEKVRRVEIKVEGKVEHMVDEVGDGWRYLEHEGTFGKNHQYFHRDFENMVHFDQVHLDEPDHAMRYMEHHARKCAHQEVHFNMHGGDCKPDRLNKFARALERGHHVQKLRLSWYENRHLTFKHFEDFMCQVEKMENLKKLTINLRWCHQVDDEWMRMMADKLPDCLEHFELWLWNCKNVHNEGLQCVTECLGKCRRLSTVKLFVEGTGCDSGHRSHMDKFFKGGKFNNMRMVGCGMDQNEC